MTGGSATHAGIGFQDRVAGLLAVHVVADAPVDFFGLPSHITPTSIELETSAPVDDILVGTNTAPMGAQPRDRYQHRGERDDVADINRTVVGWFHYFKHSHRSFKDLDEWIRTRLRSLLRKRAGFRRRRRTADYLRWPVRFFTAHGLSSMAQARVEARQSGRR